MKYRALVVEDDSEIAESVFDTLDSLGHEYVWVKSQEEGRAQIAAGGFTFVLLDLQIPVRFGRGLACIEYGEHLAREMHESPTMRGVPIIVMTAYGKEGLEIAAPLCEHGVVDFINKPFPRTGRTLASLIQSVLERTWRRRDGCDARPAGQRKPFRGGQLVFHADRVELCGIKVCGGPECGIMRALLDTLRERRPDRRYKAFSGAELARRAGADRGQNAAAEAIRGFRQKVQQLLLDELNMDCDACDVIENNRRHGYRFSEKIEVRNHDDPVIAPPHKTDGTANPADPVFHAGIQGHESTEPSMPDGPVFSRTMRDHAEARGERGTANDPAGTTDVRKNAADDQADHRLRWLREQLGAGRPLRREDLERQFGVSITTAKRDFRVLRDAGEIEFVGAAKTGHYRLAARQT